MKLGLLQFMDDLDFSQSVSCNWYLKKKVIDKNVFKKRNEFE